MSHILTLDAGTSAVKCSLVNDRGALEFACTAEYPVYYPGGGRAEQHADELLAAVVKAVRDLDERGLLKDVAAVGLTGTMNGCIPLDRDGSVLYPCIIHLDTRAIPQVEELERNIGGAYGLYKRTGNRPDVHYGLPKMMWLKAHEPDVYQRTACCVNTKDLVYGFLTGIHDRTDYSDAALFGALNAHTHAWDADVIRAAGVDDDKLPRLFPSRDVSGCISKAAAALTGLKAGTPVAIGSGDGPATTHGSGVYVPGAAYLTVGSSAWAGTLSETPCISEDMRVFNYADMDDRYTTVVGTVQCASTALDYMLKSVLNITLPDGSIDFETAEKLCFSAPAGAHGLIYLPTLMGERCPWWDAKARGTLFGLTLSHTRADMVRAAYEGIAQELNNCVDALRESGLRFDSLTLSGGALRGSVFRHIFPDVFGCPTKTHPDPREATSLGAAMAAGVGVGIWKNYKEAAVCAHTSAITCPGPDREAYKKQTPVFRSLYGQTKEAMHSVYALQEELK